MKLLSSLLYGCYTMSLCCAGVESQGSSSFRPVHILNLDVKDNHEDATLGAFLILELCEMVRYEFATGTSII